MNTKGLIHSASTNSTATTTSTNTTTLSPSASSLSIAPHANGSTHDLEDKYSDTALYPSPPRFDKIIPLDERYITHSTFLKNKSSETTFIGLLTSSRLYKVDPDTNKKIWSIDLLDIHSVEGDESADPKTLKIVYHVRSNEDNGHAGASGSPAGSRLSGTHHRGGDHHNTSHRDESNNPETTHTESPNLQTRISMFTQSALKRGNENYIREKLWVAESEDIRDQWLIAVRLVSRNLFQKFFESNFIPSPAFYQLHLYVYKINRKGKTQVRCVLISSERFYNISVKQSLEIGKVKWSFPLASLKNLQIFKNPPNLLIVHIDNKENSKVKEHQQFITRDSHERNLLANELRRLYNKLTKQQLNKEEKEENSHYKKTSLKFIIN
ncbi:hypothetical protein DFA_04538 [Cavenderia fasciculata]|uniref:TH1 domain-containing protein n=1 Tax=Cavenderia fasciculata TaxID=261658 RepID=F4PPV4_CACFS|nr:uncharacterized protein DFA_04538 [Cavenderia fasciculata]EGG22417.1 hypothetical protein DFA_04538 [Cavenderia fasciculata]|eukprot:XP_004360268.1 hypothetical protein DFA_04538 [Cavenderia fasciculata]